ncbi:ankyrin repeat-containing domain protein, partial [Baffinella frigidus]
DGPSPLQIACYWGHVDTASLLIGKGADLNALTPDGYSLLYIAAMFANEGKGSIDIVKLLLEGGTDVSHVEPGGYTILHSAADFEFNRDILDTLVAAGVDIDAPSATNDTPLHIAAMRGDTELVEFFLQNNACIDALDDDGHT